MRVTLTEKLDNRKWTTCDNTGISKKGWEHMWVRYADAEDAAAKAIVKKPVAVYIAHVYDEGKFAAQHHCYWFELLLHSCRRYAFTHRPKMSM